MNYWDSSALVAWIVEQDASAQLQTILASDPAIFTWTLSEIEIASALARLHREAALDTADLEEAAVRARALWSSIDSVAAVDAVKLRARRLLRTHSLRAADALHLAAALLVASDDPTGWSFVCLDDRLSEAARREGFRVLPK